MRSAPNHSSLQWFAKVPGWARKVAPLTESEAAFAVGAALAILDGRTRAEPIPQAQAGPPGKEKEQAPRSTAFAGVWRCRLALTAAAASAKIIRRGEDAATLRDAFYLRDGTADPGPAGRIVSAWRSLDRSAPLDDQALLHVTGLFGLGIDAALKAALAEVQHLGTLTDSDAPVAAAAAATIILRQRPDADLLALWVADAMLAVRLKWRRPLPLIATALDDRALRQDAGRRPHPLDKTWPTACCAAYARAAVAACDLFDILADSSRKLTDVRAHLRAKGARAVIERLHDEDAVSAAQPMLTISDRALRRLFDRLVALGAVRELTGRSTFRLYGL